MLTSLMKPLVPVPVLVVLLLLVGAVGLSIGRFTAPVKVETKTEFKSLSTEELTKGMNFTRVVTRTVRRDVTTTITDAGTVIVDKSTEHEGDDTKKSEDTGVKKTNAVASTAQTATTVRPDWRVAAQVGMSIQEPAIPITGKLVIGVQAERRIAGGLSAGIWANSVGAGGAVISLEF